MQMNALHYAATTALGNVNIVAMLSKEDVSLANKRDNNGQTPLHLVTKNGQFDVVKRLKKDYPDVIEVLDNKQRNILHLVAQQGYDEIVTFISLSLSLNAKYYLQVFYIRTNISSVKDPNLTNKACCDS